MVFSVTEKEEESWGEVIRKGRNEPKGKRNLWSSVNEGSRNQRQIKRGKFFTFFLACIASVSNRVIARKLERKQKKGWRGRGRGEEEVCGQAVPSFPSPSPVIHVFCSCPSFLDEPREETLATQATFFCVFVFLKGPCRADIAVLETDHDFFWRRTGGWKTFTCKHFFKCGSCCKQFFVCLPLPGSTLFLFAYNLFQCLQPLQTIYSKIFQPHPPPPPIKKIMVCPLGQLCLSHYLMSRKNKFVLFVCLAKLASH